MQFGLSKCAVLTMVKGKRTSGVGIELPSGEVMEEVDEEGYKYLGSIAEGYPNVFRDEAEG